MSAKKRFPSPSKQTANKSLMTSRTTKSTSKRDLNATTNPQIKETLFRTNVDFDLECDFAYNDMLQAMMKKQIVDGVLQANKSVVKLQLHEQQNNLLKLKMAHKKLLNEINDIQKLDQVVEVLNVLEKYVKDVNELFDRFDVGAFISEMLVRLKLECDKVVLKNVKSIAKQEELDFVMKKIQGCQKIVENIMQCGADKTGLNDAASALRHNLELHQDFASKRKLFNDLLEEGAFNYLKLCSDYFADNKL